jgi:hypothetical protein
MCCAVLILLWFGCLLYRCAAAAAAAAAAETALDAVCAAGDAMHRWSWQQDFALLGWCQRCCCYCCCWALCQGWQLQVHASYQLTVDVPRSPYESCCCCCYCCFSASVVLLAYLLLSAGQLLLAALCMRWASLGWLMLLHVMIVVGC